MSTHQERTPRGCASGRRGKAAVMEDVVQRTLKALKSDKLTSMGCRAGERLWVEKRQASGRLSILRG